MSRYLCIVRRDDPLLHGYVSVALSEGMSSDDEIEIIVDRRGEATDPADAPGRIERRRRAGAERRLLEEGYVVVPLDDGPGRLRSVATRRHERPADMPWRGLLAVGAGLVLVIGTAIALSSADGIVDRVRGVASGWARPLSAVIDAVAGLQIWPSRASVPSPPAPAPSPAPVPSPPAPVATPETPPDTPRDVSPKPPPATEPSEQSPSAATAGKRGHSFDAGAGAADGGTGAAPEQLPRPASPALPPRPAEKRLGAVRSGPAHETEGDAGAAADPIPVPAPTNVSRAASTAGFPGVPDVQVEWYKAQDGRAIAYAARLHDEAGHPVAAAEVTLLIRLPGEGVREVPLSGTGHPGTYQGRMTGADADPDDLRVRVVLEGKRFEIPTLMRASGHGG
jgi:hypothetical protein